MKKVLISILLTVCFIFTGCDWYTGSSGNSGGSGNDNPPSERPPSGESTVTDPTQTVEDEFAIDTSSVDYTEYLQSKTEYPNPDNPDESLDLDLFAGFLLVYGRDYSKETNNANEKTNIKNKINESAETVLTNLAELYGPDYANIVGWRGLSKERYSAFLHENYTTDQAFREAVSYSDIMQMPIPSVRNSAVSITSIDKTTISIDENKEILISGIPATAGVTTEAFPATTTYNLTSVTIQITGEEDQILTTGLDAITVQTKQDTFTVVATYTAGTESFTCTFSVIAGLTVSVTSTVITDGYTTVIANPTITVEGIVYKVKITWAADISATNFDLIRMVGYETESFTVSNSPRELEITIQDAELEQGQSLKVGNTISYHDAKGVYKLVCGDEEYFIFLGQTANELNGLRDIMIKNTNFDAIRNGWWLDNGVAAPTPWNWSLTEDDYITVTPEQSVFINSYVSKYSKALQLAIAKIQVFGYEDSQGNYLNAIPSTSYTVKKDAEYYNVMGGTYTTTSEVAYLSLRTLYSDAMAAVLENPTSNNTYFNDFMYFCYNYIDRIGFSAADNIRISRFIQDFVMGKDLARYDESLLIAGEDLPANGVLNYRGTNILIDTKAQTYSISNSPAGYYDGYFYYADKGFKVDAVENKVYVYDEENINSVYFKNYTTTAFSILFDIEEGTPITYEKMVCNLAELYVIASSEEDGEIDDGTPGDFNENSDDEATDTINPNTIGDLKSITVIPNANFFTDSHSDKILHILGLYMGTESTLDLEEYIDIIITYQHLVGVTPSKDVYYMNGAVDGGEVSISAYDAPFSNDGRLLTGQTIGSGDKVYSDYGFKFSAAGLPSISYINITMNMARINTNGTNTTVMISGTGENRFFTYNSKRFYVAEDNSSLTVDNLTIIPTEAGRFTYIPYEGVKISGQSGNRVLSSIVCDFEYLEIAIKNNYVGQYNETLTMAAGFSGGIY